MPAPSRGVRNARPPPRPRLTHFLALTSSALTPTHTTSPPKPLSNPIATTYNRFRTLATSPPHNIPPQAIRPLGTMHLTLGVMSLKDEGEVERAKRALGEAVERYKLERGKEKEKGRVEEEEGGGAGTGVGGVRVKLVGLRTFDPQGHGPRRKRGKDKREKAFGSISGNSSNNTNMTGVSIEEAEEIEDAEEEGEGGGEGEGEGDDRPAWEQPNKEIPEPIPSNPKPDYSNCRVLWVEPLDSDIPISTTTTSNSQIPSLHSLSLFVRDFFLSQNLLSIPPQEKTLPLTLHLTMLNASHAKKALQSSHGGGGRGRGGGGRGKEGHHKEGYDVRGLVKEFENVVWADNVLFDRVEVMRMGEVKGEIGSEREGESWYVSVESAEL